MNLLLQKSYRLGLLIIVLLISVTLYSQPYLDIFQTKYVYSPDAGIHKQSNIRNTFSFMNAQLNLPLIFKKDSSMLVFNPILENWQVNVASQPYLPNAVTSLALPLYFIKPLSQKWSITITPTLRWNGSGHPLFKKEFLQLGGFSLLSFKKRPNLSYRFGIYYNSEFSGPFFMLLAGIDWKINSKNNLFGVLPGMITFEHKAADWLYYGATFRAITNSYAYALQGTLTPRTPFIRIDENQLGFFAAAYIKKRIVLQAEAGHSIIRKFRFGLKDAPEKYSNTEKTRDNLYVSATLAYRMRFR